MQYFTVKKPVVIMADDDMAENDDEFGPVVAENRKCYFQEFLYIL